MRKDIEFKAEDGTHPARLALPAGWCIGSVSHHRHGPWLLRGEGDVSRPLCGGLRQSRICRAGVRQPQLRCERWPASAGDRSLAADPRLSGCHHLLLSLAETDPQRIGIWGSSYSGAHVLVVGAIDRRVKCIVSQAPMISGLANFRRLVRADVIGPLRQMFADDRAARYRGETPTMVPVVSNDPMQPCALPTPDSWTWFHRDRQQPRPGLAQ